MKRSNSGWVLVLIVSVLLILANLLSLQSYTRIDLTRDKKFTLAKATKEAVKKLKDTVTVSAYFSENLPPPYSQHARYVRDLLEEYEASSDRFAFEFIDPVTHETDQDKARKKDIKRDIFGRIVRETTSVENELSELGVLPVEIQVIEGDEQQTKRAFMGLLVRFQDKYEVIPVVQNLSDLEKDLTGLILKLTREKTPKIGLIKDPGINIERISQVLKENLLLEPVTEQEPADDLDALLILGSTKSMGEDAFNKLERFINKGKSVAFLLDQFPVDAQTFELKHLDFQDPALRLLAGLGITFLPSLVADTSCASINIEEPGRVDFPLPAKYPFVPELMTMSLSPITKGLSGILLPFVSPITLDNGSRFKTTVLAQSSKVSWLEVKPFNINPRRDWALAKIEPNGPYNLMVQAEELSKSPKARLIVVGTSAFIWDEFISEPNLILAHNMMDWLVADSSMLMMRAREFADAPLDQELSDLARKVIKYCNILGVPLLLILCGFLRWRKRESQRRLVKRMAQAR